MKKIFAFTMLLLCLSVFAKAQTTMEEYNYVSNGLIDDVSKSKDIKAGYSLQDLYISELVSWTNGQWRNIKLYSFNKNGQRKAIAVEFSDSDRSRTFRCVPTKFTDQSIWTLANASFGDLGQEWNTVLARAFVKLASRL